MTFLSFTFAAFLGASLLVYWGMPKKVRPYVLLAVSVAFYLFSGPKYIAYIAAATAVTYVCALLVYKNNEAFAAGSKALKAEVGPDAFKKLQKKSHRKSSLFVALALLCDLGILCVIKYLDFLLGNLWSLFGKEFSGLGLMMPLGLSYFTFAAVGYIIDVSRGKYAPERNFAKFALYMTYFPQMLQGPIPRFDFMGTQLCEEKSIDVHKFADGLRLCLWGAFKMLVIASTVAPLVANVSSFGAPGYKLPFPTYTLGGAQIWVGMIAWGIQLYTSFSGGIDIAEGISECFGITMAENFKRPYFAVNLTDYWNRWHISLSEWLKDYVFYPMALSKRFARFSKFLKNKFGKFIAKTVPVGLLSLLLFTLVGIWHGANWGEILFGVFNGVIILISTLLEPLFVKIRKPLRMDKLLIWRIFRALRTFVLITLTRVVSKAPSVTMAMAYYRAMFLSPAFGSLQNYVADAGGIGPLLLKYLPAIVGCLVLFAVSLTEEKHTKHSLRAILADKPVLRVSLELLCLAAVVVFGSYGIGFDSAAFIYSHY